MRLRDSALNDDEAVAELFAGIIRSLMLEGKYLILLTFDKYDVPSYSKDDIKIDALPPEFYLQSALWSF